MTPPELPVELHLEIISRLHIRTMSTCALACKAWTGLVQPLLFRATRFDVHDAELVLQALTDSRSLQSHVKTLTIMCSETRCHNLPSDVGSPERELAESRIVAALQTLALLFPNIKRLNLNLGASRPKNARLRDVSYVSPFIANCVRAVAGHVTHLAVYSKKISRAAVDGEVSLETLFSSTAFLPRAQALHVSIPWTDELSTIVASTGDQLRVLSLGTYPILHMETAAILDDIAANCEQLHTICLGNATRVNGDLSWLEIFPSLRTLEIPRTDLMQENINSLPASVEHLVVNPGTLEELAKMRLFIFRLPSRRR